MNYKTPEVKKQTIDFYYSDGKICLAVLDIDGEKHFSCDIRDGYTELTIGTSNKTLPDKYFNDERVNELVNAGIYEKKTVEVETEFCRGYISHTYIKKPF